MAKLNLETVHYAKFQGSEMYSLFCTEYRKANKNIFDDIRYLDVNEMFKELHIVCFKENHKVIADLALQQSPEDENVYWLKHISVSAQYRKQGIAGRLLNLCIDHIRTVGKELHVSSYSEMGELYLAPVIVRLMQTNTDVVILDKLNRLERSI